MKVYIVAHPLSETDRFSWECQGVFSSVEKAAAACRVYIDEVVEFTLDEDATDIENFAVLRPLAH